MASVLSVSHQQNRNQVVDSSIKISNKNNNNLSDLQRSWSPAHIYQEIVGYTMPSDKGSLSIYTIEGCIR